MFHYSSAIRDEVWRVVCDKPFCAQGPDGYTEAEAIEAWNTRSAGTCGKQARKTLRIEQFLKEKGLTKAKAARMCDVNESSMSRIVRGIEPPYPKRGQRIADALGWQGDWQELFEEVEVSA